MSLSKFQLLQRPCRDTACVSLRKILANRTVLGWVVACFCIAVWREIQQLQSLLSDAASRLLPAYPEPNLRVESLAG